MQGWVKTNASRGRCRALQSCTRLYVGSWRRRAWSNVVLTRTRQLVSLKYGYHLRYPSGAIITRVCRYPRCVALSRPMDCDRVWLGMTGKFLPEVFGAGGITISSVASAPGAAY